jgi:hypothetical protein
LFWIFTLFPITTRLPTKTFCPRTQLAPMRAPPLTWTQCQIFVPAPICAPSSITAVPWAQ